MTDQARLYRLPGTRLSLRGAYIALSVGLVGLCVDYSNREGSLPVPMVIGFTVTAAALAIWFELVSVRTGLEEVDAGFVIRQNFSWHLLHLDELDHFEHYTFITMQKVSAVLRDGRVVPIPGLQQGRRVVWRGGETRDIVEVLNERLRERRQPRPETD